MHRRPPLSPRTFALLLVLVLGLAACGGGDDDAAPDPGDRATTTATTAPSVDPTEPAPSEPSTSQPGGPSGQLDDQYGVRYCEVLTVQVAPEATTAEVWGTQGLNDCPQEAFASLDPAAVAAELGVTIAVPNGPRYWVLDDIVANELAGSGERRSFGGIEMRSIAVVDLGTGVPDRRPYAETAVKRDTEFAFDAGREVHELTAPDGSVYVMQSYSVEIDPSLDPTALAGLASRLSLPEGWTFASRVLDERLAVEDVDGTAVVVQDDLRNSYQLRSRG
jgi:hypothetical protein